MRLQSISLRRCIQEKEARLHKTLSTFYWTIGIALKKLWKGVSKVIYSNGRPALVFDEKYDIDLTPEVLAYELAMEFADQIIAECARQGLSHADLAARLEIKPSTLSEKLNGQNLTLKSIASMALALDCDVKTPALVRKEESSRVLPEFAGHSEMVLHTDAPDLKPSFTGNLERGCGDVQLLAGASDYDSARHGFSYAIDQKDRKAA